MSYIYIYIYDISSLRVNEPAVVQNYFRWFVGERKIDDLTPPPIAASVAQWHVTW